MLNKYFFVHIPKTAGSYIKLQLKSKKLLQNESREKFFKQHMWGKNWVKRKPSHLSFKSNKFFPNYTLMDGYKESYNRKKVITSIRNPYDLLCSYYHHGENGWGDCNKFHKINSFKQFIDYYCNCDANDWHVPELNKCLYGQIFNSKGKSNINYVLFYENLENNIIDLTEKNFLNKMFKKNFKKKFTATNVSLKKKRSYVEYYNNYLIKLVKKKCEYELDTFQYSFKTKKNKKIIEISKLVY